jgi:hypothetical protein
MWWGQNRSGAGGGTRSKAQSTIWAGDEAAPALSHILMINLTRTRILQQAATGIKEARLYFSKPSYLITSTSTTAAKIVVMTITVLSYSSRRHLLQTKAKCKRLLHMQGVTTGCLRDHACHHVNRIPHGPVLLYTFHSLLRILSMLRRAYLPAMGLLPRLASCMAYSYTLVSEASQIFHRKHGTRNTRHEA